MLQNVTPMAKLKIHTYPDPILKQIAGPLTDFGPKMQKLFDDMIETMYQDDGVGLAAPQVGVSFQILIASPAMKAGEEYVIVNPEIIQEWGRESAAEGCLSLPGLAVEIARAKQILLRYQDRQGKAQEVKLKDFFARIVQHEMDHLRGILLIDRVPFNERLALLAEYKKF